MSARNAGRVLLALAAWMAHAGAAEQYHLIENFTTPLPGSIPSTAAGGAVLSTPAGASLVGLGDTMPEDVGAAQGDDHGDPDGTDGDEPAASDRAPSKRGSDDPDDDALGASGSEGRR